MKLYWLLAVSTLPLDNPDMLGVRKAFYPGGAVKDTNDIEEMFDTGTLTGPSLSVLDLTK